MLAKINLSSGAVVEFPAEFPLPGVLREVVAGRQVSRANAAEIAADPRAYFGPARTVQEFDRDALVLDEAGNPTGEVVRHFREVERDPCPPALDGFGWWPVVDVRPALSLGQVYAAEPDLAVDVEARVVTATYAVISDPAAIAAAMDALEIDLIGGVKRAAGDVILARYPDWKQRNMTAEAAALTRVLAAGGAWTAEQADRAAVLDGAWAWVSAIRAASDAAEAAIAAAKGDAAAMRAAAAVDWEGV